MKRSSSIAAAYLLDSLLGDPRGYPHPVRLMGAAVSLLERGLRRVERDGGAERRAGWLLAAAVVGGAWLAARSLAFLPGTPVTETLLIYTALARRDLEVSALRVAESLEEGDLEGARSGLRALVGRDLEGLDAHGMGRAAVESVAENYTDGVLAPLLWAALGGAPAAAAFKAVSTLDSMVGHRDERYIDFGRASARLDDAAVFLAARLSVPLVACAALLRGGDAGAAARIGWRDRRNHASPNSAHAEAAFAGALGLRLGGPDSYGGLRRDLPCIGEGTPQAGPAHIREAAGLLNTASQLGLALALLLSWRWRG